MNTTATRQWLINLRPAHLESLRSYCTRLLAANHETPTQLRYLAAQMDAPEPSAGEIEVLEAKTGRDLHRLTAGALPAHKGGGRCELCTDGLNVRWVCVDCAHGQHLTQHTHFEQNVCLKHRRWVGPGTLPDHSSQLRVGRRGVTAERKFRRLLAQGRIDAHLYAVVDRAVASALGTSDRPQDYPLVISIISALTGPHTAAALFDPTRSFAKAYRVLRALLAPLVGATALDQVARAIWVVLRPTFLVVRECLAGAHMTIPPHELLLPEEALAFFRTGVIGPLEPFDRYLPAAGVSFTQRNKVVLLTDYSRTTLTQMNPADTGAPRPLICPNGHRCRARSSKVLHGSGAGDDFCPVCQCTELIPGLNSLDLTHPRVAADFDRERNGTLTPSDLLATSRQPVAWICAKSHRMTESPAARVADGCRLCSYKLVTPANSLRAEYPAIAAMLIPERTPAHSADTLHANSTETTWWRCPHGHTFRSTPHKLVAGATCHFCRTNAGNARAVSAFPLLVDEWDHARNPENPDEVKIGRQTAVWWICPNDHNFAESPYRRSRGYDCPQCGNPRKLRPGHNDAATLEPVLMREYSRENGPIEPQDLVATGKRRVRWQCLAHGHPTTQSIPERKAARGCPTCAPTERILTTNADRKAP